MGCPSLSSRLLRQMSPVSAAITPRLNINDSLAWQVLAGQRRGESGTPLDKTRDEKAKWWLYLPDRFPFVSVNLRICMCAISRFLAWHDGFIALFFLPSEEMDLFVFPLPLILPAGISDIPSSICACACVCMQAYGFLPPPIGRSTCASSISSCVFLGESILDFDVGNSDGGDGRSQGRVVPEGWVVRGEGDGEEGEAEWRQRPLLVESVSQFSYTWLHVTLRFLQRDEFALWNISFFCYFFMVLLHSSFPLRSLFPSSHWSPSPSHSPCCNSGLWPLSPSLFWIINSPAQGSEWVLLSRHSTELHIAHISDVRPFKGITLPVPPPSHPSI